MNPQSKIDSSHFLLVGNGPYLNRGCEAIVRGTMEILRATFGPDIRAEAGVIATPHDIERQQLSELDPSVKSFSIHGAGRRGSSKWFAGQLNKRFGTSITPYLWDLDGRHHSVIAALQIGGDNYSLDYSRPDTFLTIDDYLRSKNLPVIIWGASIGPFDADPTYARSIFAHLRSLTGIFVRESASFDYLKNHGVDKNLHLVADPAFLMHPTRPENHKLPAMPPDGAIGLNLSPLMAHYKYGCRRGEGLDRWESECLGIIVEIATLGLPITLIPHVEASDPTNDDFIFLEKLYRKCQILSIPIFLIPRGLTAAELKWVISRCSLFAGARTHSTIAALSSHVPTLSIGYSIKAKGINNDIYGHLDYCIPIPLLNKTTMTETLEKMKLNQEAIRGQLHGVMPRILARALQAGQILKEIIT